MKLWGIGDANAAISMPLPKAAGKTTAFVHAWAVLLGFDAARGWNTLG